MKEGFWKKILTNDHRYSLGHPEYRRVYLLNIVLLIIVGICLFFCLIDALFCEMYLVAGINGAAVILALATLRYFHKTDNIKRATLLTVLIMLGTLSLFFGVVEHKYYALSWIAVYPPVVYFLLGGQKARFVTCGYGALLLIFMLARYKNWQQAGFEIESILNIGGAAIALILMISYFELSRKEAAMMLEEKNKELERLSVTDYLTGLYNRMKLDEMIAAEIARVSRNGRCFSIILADLDYFKEVNDHYGHIAGDSVLIDIARILKNTCRQTDIVGRWGGEEFLIISPETDKQGLKILADRLLKNVLTYQYKGVERVTISLGATAYFPGDTADTILKRADDALYSGKAKGRCRVEMV